MFNKDLKKAYLTYDGSNIETLTNYFLRTALKEENYDKDLCEMNEPELLDTLLSLKIKKHSSRAHAISMFRGYISWAKLQRGDMSISAIDLINAVTIRQSNVLQFSMIGSPEEADNIMRATMKDNADALELRNRRDKLVFLLIYAGLTMDELVMLKKTDIDVNRQVVLIKDNTGNTLSEVPVSDEVCTLWKTVALTDHIDKHSSGGSYIYITQALVDSAFLFRPIQGKAQSRKENLARSVLASVILNILIRYSEESGTQYLMSPSNIRLSGVFYKLLELEQAGHVITTEVVEKINRKQLKPSAAGMLLLDYKDWKIGFGYEDEESEDM